MVIQSKDEQQNPGFRDRVGQVAAANAADRPLRVN